VALAARAHVTTSDLEFVQFHPTALNWPHTPPFLLTEALRGEGAILRDKHGRAFCRDYHEDGELAPRDVVARAVFDTRVRTNGGTVYLDITHRDPDWVRARFPTIQKHLRTIGSGLDLATDWLPVVPAAHYTCGGIATDLDGCTSLPGLYAAGEAARTGLHGGNRLASTSLLEGLVFGASVADHVGSEKGRSRSLAAADAISTMHQSTPSSPNANDMSGKQAESVSSAAQRLLRRVRRVMWDNVGVTRTESGLTRAVGELYSLRDEANELFAATATMETAAARDATCAGYEVARAALANPRSVGAHCIVKEAEQDSDDEADGMAMAVAR
jgi:L-aspartate oxidase